jgi:hypothetical protein
MLNTFFDSYAGLNSHMDVLFAVVLVAPKLDSSNLSFNRDEHLLSLL